MNSRETSEILKSVLSSGDVRNDIIDMSTEILKKSLESENSYQRGWDDAINTVIRMLEKEKKK